MIHIIRVSHVDSENYNIITMISLFFIISVFPFALLCILVTLSIFALFWNLKMLKFLFHSLPCLRFIIRFFLILNHLFHSHLSDFFTYYCPTRNMYLEKV